MLNAHRAPVQSTHIAVIALHLQCTLRRNSWCITETVHTQPIMQYTIFFFFDVSIMHLCTIYHLIEVHSHNRLRCYSFCHQLIRHRWKVRSRRRREVILYANTKKRSFNFVAETHFLTLANSKHDFQFPATSCLMCCANMVVNIQFDVAINYERYIV